MDARWPSAVYFQPFNGASIISPAAAVPYAGSKYALLNNIQCTPQQKWIRFSRASGCRGLIHGNSQYILFPSNTNSTQRFWLVDKCGCKTPYLFCCEVIPLLCFEKKNPCCQNWYIERQSAKIMYTLKKKRKLAEIFYYQIYWDVTRL